MTYKITITNQQEGFTKTAKARNKNEVIRILSNYIADSLNDQVEVSQ